VRKAGRDKVSPRKNQPSKARSVSVEAYIAPSDPVFSIGRAAERVGVSQSTLRLYEREGLISPAKSKSGRRLYSVIDLMLVEKIRILLRDHGLNFAGVRAYFSAIPCWRMKDAKDGECSNCSAYQGQLVPCWSCETARALCPREDCARCEVYAAAAGLPLPQGVRTLQRKQVRPGPAAAK